MRMWLRCAQRNICRFHSTNYEGPLSLTHPFLSIHFSSPNGFHFIRSGPYFKEVLLNGSSIVFNSHILVKFPKALFKQFVGRFLYSESFQYQSEGWTDYTSPCVPGWNGVTSLVALKDFLFFDGVVSMDVWWVFDIWVFSWDVWYIKDDPERSPYGFSWFPLQERMVLGSF